MQRDFLDRYRGHTMEETPELDSDGSSRSDGDEDDNQSSNSGSSDESSDDSCESDDGSLIHDLYTPGICYDNHDSGEDDR